MIDFSEIPEDGEIWELFARDFLQELGFIIEQPPDRGPDGGKDILVLERLKGNLGNYDFRWLVSCKHFANSKKSVQEKDEINIQERLTSFNANGFLGFYSTIASAGLNTRLSQLREKKSISDYRIFDNQLIENNLLTFGFSSLMRRFLPNNYVKINPIRLVYNKYIPLKCKSCGKDLLKSLNSEPYKGIVVFLEDTSDFDNPVFTDVYWCCKGDCDRKIRFHVESSKCYTRWEDISDLIIPVYYLDWIFTHFNNLRSGRNKYTEQSFEKLKEFILALSQRALREMSDEERERAYSLFSMGRL